MQAFSNFVLIQKIALFLFWNLNDTPSTSVLHGFTDVALLNMLGPAGVKVGLIRGAIKKFCNFLPYLIRWSKFMVE